MRCYKCLSSKERHVLERQNVRGRMGERGLFKALSKWLLLIISFTLQGREKASSHLGSYFTLHGDSGQALMWVHW